MIPLLIIAAVTLVILFVKQRYAYWKVRGVPYVSPIFPLGNLWGVGTKRHISEQLRDHYGKLKGSAPFGGVFFTINPVVVALELEFVKNVLIKDFNYFHDRAIYYNERDDPLTAHLFTMEGSQWKNMRVKLTPTFTSGKMKMMFPIVRGCAEELEKCISVELEKSGEEIELKDILARFTTDVIGNCAFGIECNSLRDPNAEFRNVGRRIFNLGPFGFTLLLLAQQFRTLFKTFGFRVLDPSVTSFILKSVTEIVQYREKNDVKRSDFIDLMIKLKNGESLEVGGSNESAEGLTMKQIAAQSFVFFFAGFETSSTLMSFCLYELALHQDIQEKARQNVNETLDKHGVLTYEAVHEMKYLENCMNESLRLHPPASNLFRTATQDYKVPQTSCTIEKGTSVMIPVLAIHMDPQYYPDPEKFDPDRFNPEQVAKRNPLAFIPFGEGPRICIGQRFGLMQARVGLAMLLKSYRFSLGSRTEVPLTVMPSSAILTVKGGLVLKVEKIDE